ncbi:MAG: tRNA preQ1(34) S-adenosylmethionine ribosyltransferase-isomerase QueA, partial [Planctomycetes bacterium]|nr:tRNA preQ1(34) S-adenosylmethionine ribosyltransferase-isomerase QueA [Planctomycetota bacterium]
MDIRELDFELPPELIAQTPALRRDDSRLMLLDREAGTISHYHFRDLPRLLRAGDCLVLNDTKVRACRLYATRASSGGRVEVFLLDQVGEGRFTALTKAGGKLLEQERLTLDENCELTLIERQEDGVWLLDARGAQSQALSFDELEAYGRMPLPPYIQRAKGEEPDEFAAQDRERYQTVYAAEAGAVAAPTAGLHFTPELLNRLSAQGVSNTRLTLHVGVGTFRPVSAERVEDHPMHAERFELSAKSAKQINDAKLAGGRVIAVGSTSTRTLESVANSDGQLKAKSGSTDLMILPGYRFRVLDGMITNFHLPRSTLLALVMAFAGEDLTRRAYAEAVQERYRFFSYG